MTTRRRSIGTAALALLTGLVLAVAPQASAGDVAAPQSPVGDWRTSTNGVRQTITFDKAGRVYGKSGCNNFTGGYTYTGSKITIGPLASTMMACPEPIMAAEMTFLTRLQAAVSFHSTARVLRVHAPKDLIRFVAR